MKKIHRKKKSSSKKYLKNLKWLFIILIPILVGGIFLSFNTKEKKTTQSTSTPVSSAYPEVSPVETANWKTYSNRVYGYTIQYPPDYTLGCDELFECTDDDVEWTGNSVAFKPTQASGYGTIYVYFDNQTPEELPEKNESIKAYLNRIYPSNPQLISDFTKEVKVADREALQTVYEFNSSLYMVRTKFFYNNAIVDIFFRDDKAPEISQKLEKPIFEYPNINIYHQMIKTFKPADLPKTRKITSLYKPSSDGSFYIRAKESGYGEQIILVDNKGNIIKIDSMYTRPEFFKSVRCYECGIRFGGWIDSYQFTIRLTGAFLNDNDNDKIASGEYQYIIDARNGEIVANSLKQVK